MKRVCSLALALLMLLSLSVCAFAEDAPALTGLDTSAVDGKLIAYQGVETYFVVYPVPDEALARFDIRNAEITCSDPAVLDLAAEKVEEYRYGSVLVTGKQLGKATVTVTDPASGASCSVEVTVVPAFGYRVRNFFNFLNYLPFFLFMRIAQLFGWQ